MRNLTMVLATITIVAAACGNGEVNNPDNNGTTGITNNGTAGGDNNGSNNETTGSSNNDTSNGSNNDTAGAPVVVAEFNGAFWQLPESLAYHDGLAYLSFRFRLARMASKSRGTGSWSATPRAGRSSRSGSTPTAARVPWRPS